MLDFKEKAPRVDVDFGSSFLLLFAGRLDDNRAVDIGKNVLL